MWFIGVEVEQETSAAPPKKNPGSASDEPFFESHKLQSKIFDAIITNLGALQAF